ncbi:hypothetical protein [Tenggerimyces flavus]|uniref:Uncharacterized protein n=1 Tax=Tenggerimyces flavus TaxID=1708749 RepID=A0ABV7YP05_9ACTN|nr:hypothetical protein [Tenggerimyces flavus]MBM7785936.1 hypothetical protein [Tenggerimyces flavus]
MSTDQWTFLGVVVVAVVSLTGHLLHLLSAKLSEKQIGNVLQQYARVDDRFDELTARLDKVDRRIGRGRTGRRRVRPAHRPACFTSIGMATSPTSTRLPRPGAPVRAWGTDGGAALRSKRGDAHRPQRHGYGS